MKPLKFISLCGCLIVSLAFIARLPLVERETTFTAAHRRALNVPGVLRQLSASYLWLGWVAGFGAVVAEVAAKKLQMTPAELGLLSGLFGTAVILGNLMSGCLRRALGEAALPLLALVSAAGLFAFILPVRSGIQLALLGLPWAFGYRGAGPLHHARLSLLSEPSRGTINSYHASLLNLGIFSVSVLLGTSVRDASHSIFCAATGAIALCGACLLLPFSLRETDK
ncbi:MULTISPECIES: hypothetical protein [Variovorax]|uniref:hypothetical protein n=1 Tax=Variovorax TaxID=34072 RepID=UPI002857EEED|nr:hypothetical protein [Variovorax sp. 3319]MDR6890963.1 putative MFS family arabinose efflux permease [Variovorax sp. 3319]